jgi:selenium metabolism protein YedF
MSEEPDFQSAVLLVTNEGLGQADPELQHKLAKSYFTLLLESSLLPAVICFYTEGVRLVAAGSPVLDELMQLEEQGVRLIVCGTCLNYFGLMDQVEVGIVGGMTDIIEAQRLADKVISI